MWLLDDFKAYNPRTRRFDPLPPNGSVMKGNRCQEANPWQPFWDLSRTGPLCPRNAALEDTDKVAESFVNAAADGPSKLTGVDFDRSDFVNTVASAPSSTWHLLDSDPWDDCSTDAGSCSTREASETVCPADIFPQTSSGKHSVPCASPSHVLTLSIENSSFRVLARRIGLSGAL